MDDEMRLHQQLRADDLERAGYPRAEAERLARLEFGPAEQHKHAARAALPGLVTRERLRLSSLDFKLGFRMLARYPGLTIVAGLAIAFGVASGTAVFVFVRQVVAPRLPLDEGTRIVGMRDWDARHSRPVALSAADVHHWQANATLLQQVGGFHRLETNLNIGIAGVGAPVRRVVMSASGFALARVAPALGRALTEADESPGAPPVVVLGDQVWRDRLAASPAVIGQRVRLGTQEHTIVGVMPPGFTFPATAQLWTPLPDDAASGGPAIHAFARLAPTASVAAAQAQLRSLGRDPAHAAADSIPGSLQVLPYVRALSDLSRLEIGALWSLNVVALLFLLLIGGNVALLMHARTLARHQELVVRSALGASASRIILQLFSEALVLASASSALGLFLAHLMVREAVRVLEAAGQLRPLWFDPGIAPSTMAYGAGLALLVAVVAGVLPAVGTTRGLAGKLRASVTGGPIRRRWAGAIAAQVALTVTFPAMAFFVQRDAGRLAHADAGFASARFLAVELDGDSGALTAAKVAEIERRLEAEAGIAGVTRATILPRMGHPQRPVQVEGLAVDTTAMPQATTAGVAPDYFATLDTKVSGRPFTEADASPEAAPVVIVNAPFVRHMLAGRQAIGRRIRLGDTAGAEWAEIVGVVPSLAMTAVDDPSASGAGVYYPAREGASRLYLAIRVAEGMPARLESRVRELVAQVDPAVRLPRVGPLDLVQAAELQGYAFFARVLAAAGMLALLLSLAGIYAVTSFAVARQTREIGIRTALGAPASRVVRGVVAGPLLQVTVGVAAGTALVLALSSINGEAMGLAGITRTLAYSLAVAITCLLACVAPARRALAIQPTMALRTEL